MIRSIVKWLIIIIIISLVNVLIILLNNVIGVLRFWFHTFTLILRFWIAFIVFESILNSILLSFIRLFLIVIEWWCGGQFIILVLTSFLPFSFAILLFLFRFGQNICAPLFLLGRCYINMLLLSLFLWEEISDWIR